MSKRFTETEKWDDKWFRSLTPGSKLLFIFMLDKCDLAGFYEIDPDDIEFRTGLPSEKVLGAIQGLDRGLIINGDWVWIKNFLKHQKNDSLNPENNAHKHIIRLIAQKIEMFPDIPKILGANKGLFSPIGKGKGISKGKSVADVHFDEFWSAYPNKSGKVAARKAWSKNKCDEIKDEIVLAVERQKEMKQWKKDNGEFIPHASTWLNQKRWEDDVNVQPVKQYDLSAVI